MAKGQKSEIQNKPLWLRFPCQKFKKITLAKIPKSKIQKITLAKILKSEIQDKPLWLRLLSEKLGFSHFG